MPFSARQGFFGSIPPALTFPNWPVVPTWDDSSPYTGMNTEFTTNYVTSGNATVEYSDLGVINDFGDNQRRHGVAHPNGNIYILNRNNTQCVVYDPTANTASILQTNSSNHQGGAVSGYDGKIYMPPHETSSNNSILVLDANASTVSAIDGVLTTNGFQGAISLGNNILFVNANGVGANSVIYNVEANSATVTNLSTTVNFEYTGAVYHPETGNVYCMPYNGTAIVEYDPVNDVVDRSVGISSRVAGTPQNYNSGCLGADGKIYGAHSLKKEILVYDPASNVLVQDTYGLSISDVGYLEGALGADGNIYQFPAPYFSTAGGTNKCMVICTDTNNPAYNTAIITDHGITATIVNQWGATAGANNTIVTSNEGGGTGTGATHVYVVRTTGSGNINAQLSPWLNKGI